MARMKSTPKRLPSWNWESGTSRRRNLDHTEPPSIEENSMPPLVVEDPHSLRDFVGREIQTTEWLSVTSDRIQQFAETTEDRQWIHVDPERAQRDSPYGTTIAHGFLTLSLLSHFLQQAIQIGSGVRMSVNYGLNRVRFPSPVPAGSRVRARFTLQAIKHIADGVEATFSVVIEGENSEKPCCVAEWVIRYYL
jgi:acyl dehydratase